jgi:hypothetical protein
MMLICALIDAAEDTNKRDYYRKMLTKEGRHRRDCRISKCALVDLELSLWEKVYKSGNDRVIITVTGFDCKAFQNILLRFMPYFYQYTPWTGENEGATYKEVVNRPNWSGGRPCKITPASCLGLCLAWYRFEGAGFLLKGWFGFTGNHSAVGL